MRQVIVLSVALFVALVASYVTWTDEGEELDDTEVAMYRAASDDIASITWDGDESTTTITRRTDAKGDYFYVDSVVRKEKKIPTAAHTSPADDESEDAEDAEDEDAEDAEDADAEDAEPEFEVEVEETESHFVGNDQTAELWGRFAPLMAMRELVIEDGTDTTVFGLDEPGATITVKRDDKDMVLTVGAETYGSKDLYVGYADRVFLVDNKTLQPLEFAAQRLVERALHPVEEREATSLDLTWPDGTKRTWTHEERPPSSDVPNARPTQVWASAEKPDEADDAAATWIDKLLRLRLRSYLTPEEEQALVLRPVFEVVVHDEDGDWPIEVLEAQDDEGETNWYARSAFNRSTVLLTASLARGVTEDLGNLRP